VQQAFVLQSGQARRRTEFDTNSYPRVASPDCPQCRRKMKFIRAVPRYRASPAIDCFHCVACGLDETIAEGSPAPTAVRPAHKPNAPRGTEADGLEFLSLAQVLGVPRHARTDPRSEHHFTAGRRTCSRCTSKVRCRQMVASGRVPFSELSSFCPGVGRIVALLEPRPGAPGIFANS
jgi:hypothetical protein